MDWSLMAAIAFLPAFIPPPIRRLFETHFDTWCAKLGRAFNRYTFIEVHEDVQGSFKGNLFYRDVELYLSSLDRMHQSDYVRVHRCTDKSTLTFTLPPDETIEDSFMGAQLWWTHHCTQKQESQPQQMFWDYRGRRESNKESRSFSLKMMRGDKPRILAPYFDHISSVAKEIERKNTQRRLHTNDGCEWEQVDFKHPSTFESLALLPELKERIKADLCAFASGESYYHSVGRAWKRGYLLYGPPGTGKSSLIAAMANYLNYDIFDLELTGVTDNSELKSLLIRTTRKSIIVIEDIDCSLDFSDRSAKKAEAKETSVVPENVLEQKGSKVTLSGLLNFTDGLWSCCGEERIFVFTTNHKERLDPALLRSGRMDFHILLSYCTFPAFKVLAANYLGLHEHAFYPTMERKMQDSKVTPAEVVELLLSNKECIQGALERVMAALDEAAAKKPQLLQGGLLTSSELSSEGDSPAHVDVKPNNVDAGSGNSSSNGGLKPGKRKSLRKVLQRGRLTSSELSSKGDSAAHVDVTPNNVDAGSSDSSSNGGLKPGKRKSFRELLLMRWSAN